MGIGSWSFAQGGSEESMLPESGTIGLGYNVGSLLRTAGNLFYGSSTNNNHFVNNDNAIFAKYYLSESMAIRAQVRIGVGSGNFSHWVAQDGGTNPWVQVEDQFSQNTQNHSIGLGLEFRRGSERLQGYYGGSAIFGFSQDKGEYTYGNAMNRANGNPTYTNNFNNGSTTSGSDRVTSYTSGNGMSIGARGFIGSEFFLKKYLAIGAEFGWGAYYNTGMTGTETRERFTTELETYSVEFERNGGLSIDTDSFDGAVFLIAYF